MFDNKNDKQVYFNQIKGVLHSITEGEKFSSITLSVGHEKERMVNIICKLEQIPHIKTDIGIGEKVCVKFYPASYYKYDKWKTLVHLLDIEKIV